MQRESSSGKASYRKRSPAKEGELGGGSIGTTRAREERRETARKEHRREEKIGGSSPLGIHEASQLSTAHPQPELPQHARGAPRSGSCNGCDWEEPLPCNSDQLSCVQFDVILGSRNSSFGDLIGSFCEVQGGTAAKREDRSADIFPLPLPSRDRVLEMREKSDCREVWLFLLVSGLKHAAMQTFEPSGIQSKILGFLRE